MTRTFTGGDNIVMAAFAGTDNLCMIYQRVNWTPDRRIVTGLTFLSRIDVV